MPMIALICVPFLVSINQINLRQMRRLNDYTIAAYMSFTMLIIYLPLVFVQEDDLSIFSKFDYVDVCLLVLVAITSCAGQILRFKAL